MNSFIQTLRSGYLKRLLFSGLLILGFVSYASLSFAQCTSPASVIWNDGAGNGLIWNTDDVSNTYQNVGGSSVDVMVTLVDPDGKNIDTGNPGTAGAYTKSNGYYGPGVLTFGMTSVTSNQQVTFIYTFSEPVILENFVIADIDYSGLSTMTNLQTFQDEIDVAASFGATNVALSVVRDPAATASIVNISGQNIRSIYGNANGNVTQTDPNGKAIISSNQPIDKLTIVYSNGPNDDGASDDHAITLNGFSFCIAGPVAAPDYAFTNPDNPVDITVLANDVDGDNNLDAASLNNSGVLQPANGSIFIDPTTHEITYTPNPGYDGFDYFEYIICDLDNLCDTALVTISITGNDPPVAINDVDQTGMNQPVSTYVIGNDTDPNNNINPATLTTSGVLQPANGTTVVDGATWIITYTPDAYFTGVDTYEYTVCDYSGLCSTAQVTIAVSNCGPGSVAASGPTIAGNANAVITGTGVSNSTRTLGAPNGSVAYVNGTDLLVLDLTDYVEGGNAITLWVGAFASGNLVVSGSLNGTTWENTQSIAISGAAVSAYSYAVPGGSFYRYLRFTVSGGGDFDFDAVSYSFAPTICLPDTDGDGIADANDIDPDGDGGPSIAEDGGTGFDPAGDADNDGTPNYLDNNDATSGFPAFTDVNNDGVNDVYDADGDGIPDYLDLDADNDGIPDLIEAGGTDVNGDGIGDNLTDTDGDGLADIYDNNDTDGPDGDGSDPTTPSTSSLLDTNADGVTDTGDTDGDGLADWVDLDADNDGLPDLIEAGGIDTDGDGRLDVMVDADNDGFMDTVDPVNADIAGYNEGTPLVTTGTDSGDGTPVTPCADCDTDGDGLPDYIDLDADNDGIPDLVEAGGIDTDGDGRVDAVYAIDIDNDGFADTYDANDDTVAGNNDGGTPLVITNSDATDLLDGQSGNASLDTDGDGLADYLDLDADNDGIPDLVEAGGVDPTGTGVMDTGIAPWDVDGDGLADIYDQNNSDGPGTGSTTDGVALIMTTADTDNNGQVDVSAGESMIAGSTANNVNFDGDLVPNHLDLDADNDGIVDIIETGGTDANGDGMVDGMPANDSDGWLDAMTGVILTTADGADGNPYPDYQIGTGYPDFDGDGQPDYLDIDADNDGIVDNTEGQSTAGYIAPTTDSDGDGLNDAYELAGTIGTFGGAGITPENTDLTDMPDYLDLDTDNDAESDLVEGHDSDNDGIADAGSIANTGEPTGVDCDFDGLDDGFDNLVDCSLVTNTTDATNVSTTPGTHPDNPDSSLTDRDWRGTNRNIAGIVWEDTDEDGVIDSNEPGIAGAEVKVYDSGNNLVATVTTNADGSYLVVDLPEGDYTVVFTKPAAYGNASPQDTAGDDTIDSDADATGNTGTYVLVSNAAEIYVSAGFFGAPLPVELIHFSGALVDCETVLSWTAAAAIDFSHFAVERSQNGKTFELITKIPGGEFQAAKRFNYADLDQLPGAYYRLRLVDLDGSYDFSEIVFVKNTCEEKAQPMRLYPNPVGQSMVQLEFFQSSVDQRVVITDMLGRKLKGLELEKQTGVQQISIDVNDLPDGTYYMVIEGNDRVQSTRFVKNSR